MKKTNKISLLLCLLLAISLLALTSCDLLDGILGEAVADRKDAEGVFLLRLGRRDKRGQGDEKC